MEKDTVISMLTSLIEDDVELALVILNTYYMLEDMEEILRYAVVEGRVILSKDNKLNLEKNRIFRKIAEALYDTEVKIYARNRLYGIRGEHDL